MALKPIVTLSGHGIPIDRSDVDTDMIIPAHWMKNIFKFGYQDGLFEVWRRDPDFVLNDPRYQRNTIVVSGSNFGCGSSREHAPWALRDYGITAVIAPSFADIFRNNLPNVGLVPVQMEDAAAVRRILDATLSEPDTQIEIDLANRTVSCPAANVVSQPFFIDPGARHRLIHGLDEIDLTLELDSTITAHERQRPPWMTPVRMSSSNC
ncbi:3-isopropylmalate dehydratase small subunit [Mycolicibacterium sp.]|uniref:3-isopropylmalate dehydratase small subunit n=1 Tax=Mycolicibacterium sp. TaxID=2320850 RepID=UPI0037C96F3E